MVDSGFALDLLEYHTTSLGTAETRPCVDLALVTRTGGTCSRSACGSAAGSYLLIPAEASRTRPTGDRDRARAHPVARTDPAGTRHAGPPGPRAVPRLRGPRLSVPAACSRTAPPSGKAAPSGPVLDRFDLEAAEAGRPWMRAIQVDELRLLEASRQAEQRRQLEEAERQRLVARGAGKPGWRGPRRSG